MDQSGKLDLLGSLQISGVFLEDMKQGDGNVPSHSEIDFYISYPVLLTYFFSFVVTLVFIFTIECKLHSQPVESQ